MYEKKYAGITSELSLIFVDEEEEGSVESTPSEYIREHLIGEITDVKVIEGAIEIEDVTDEYRDIIGAKIRGLRYFNSSLAKLSFHNGYALQIGDTCSDKDKGAWFRVTSSDRGKTTSRGNNY